MRATFPFASHALAVLCLVAASCTTGRPTDQGGSLPPSAEADQRAESLARFGQAMVDERAGRPVESVSNLLAAVKLDPDNGDLRFRTALGLLQQKRNGEAQALLLDWTSRQPDSEKGWLWLALAYRADDDTEKALATYQRAMKAASRSPTAYVECSALLVRNERDVEGIKLLLRGTDTLSPPNELLASATELLFRIAAAGRLEGVRPLIPELIARVEKTLAGPSGSDPLRFLLCDLLVMNREPEKAVPVLEQLAGQHPDDVRVAQKLATVFTAMGEKSRAIETLEKLAQRDPENGRLRYFVGELYEQLEEPDRALESYRQATEARKPEPTAYLKIAMKLADEDSVAAIATLRQGQQKLPKEGRLTEMLAYLLLAENRPAEALPQFEKALTLKKGRKGEETTPAFVLSHALALQMADQPAAALRMLKDAMAENPAYLEGYVQLVLRSSDTTNALRAAHLLDGLMAGRTNDPAPLALQGLLFSAGEDFTNALQCFARAETIGSRTNSAAEPLNGQFYFWYGSAAERAGAIEQAARLFLRSLELDPDHAEAMNYLAYMWAEKGLRLDEALRWSRKSLELEPENPAYRDTLGWIYFMKGDYESALKELQKAANLMPEDPTIVSHMGDLMDKLGKADRALVYWERAFVLDPENETARTRLEKLGRDLAPLREKAKLRRAKEEKKSPSTRREDDRQPVAP